MASLKEIAPIGAIINSWNAIKFPECTPPFMTLKKGMGIDVPDMEEISLIRL